jgi:diketogulonate reductase-like aldo/keto reductase
MQAPGGKTVQIPSVGFGTWASGGPNTPASGEWVKIAVVAALKAGYRHLDCAWYYGVSTIEQRERQS